MHYLGIELSFAQVIELLGPYCGVRVLEQLKAVVPLAAYLMLFQLLVLRHPVEAAITLGFGLVAVVIGLAVFMEGLSTGLMPFGNIIGDNLPKKASMFVVLLIIGIYPILIHARMPVASWRAARAVVTNQGPMMDPTWT